MKNETETKKATETERDCSAGHSAGHAVTKAIAEAGWLPEDSSYWHEVK